jgi:7-cyano-7-deazaguanine synthase in queuosine biosynthesis
MTKDEDHDDALPGECVDIVERGGSAREGRLTCEIGEHIKFETDSLASYFLAKWEPVVFDALLVAAGVEFCDKVKRRPKFGWGRSFDLRVPVSDPERWKAPKVHDALIDAVQFLTGDIWEITFVKRRKALETPPEPLQLSLSGDLAVLPFSEGLDSRAVAGLMAEKWGDRLIRVRLGTMAHDRPKTPGGRPQPFTTTPYELKSAGHSFPESSARSRGFKFSTLSGIAAYLSKAQTIFVPESGQGALGSALVPVGQAYSDYRNHPLFTRRMELLLEALFEYRVRFEFPRLWFTKGETLAEYLSTNKNAEWSTTRSCWQDNRHVSVDGKRRQCGICAACMLRRLSVHAAGLTEKSETYVWENLKAHTFEEGAAAALKKIERAQREYAIAGTLHLDHLANLKKDATIHAQSIRLNASQVAKALEMPEHLAREKLDCLLDKHAREWKAYMTSLGSKSFVNRWTGRTA